jgi:hypothetical protein
VAGQVLLRDLVSIPDAVHDGDFVLALSKGVGQKGTITSYVVTDGLAGNFDKALSLIKSALETGSSRAAYLDGSFGSGKSHFMAVLHAILSGDADARGKQGLADVVIKHDSWLKGRKFLLVTYHLPDSQSLDSAVLGGYVKHVTDQHPGKPLPAVYIDDDLIADARQDRRRMGDEQFISQLPGADEEWGTAAWDPASLDVALSEAPGGPERRRLIGDLLAGPYSRYVKAVRADQESYITLDEGLSVISKHAKDVLGYDAVVLLLDELVLWLAGYIGSPTKVSLEAQKVSKLVESAEHERPAPIISFVPRQRDLRQLVSASAAGNEVTSLFDTLKYWDGRFEHIVLGDGNLPYIAHERLLKPKDEAARQALADAFGKSAAMAQRDWDILLDSHGDKGDREGFRLTYPFSPAFVHAMVDISSALQRERTALKLMQQLLVDYRDTLPVGKLMPLGAIFDVLAQGADRPFTDKLREEFETARRFYFTRVRPYLLGRNNVTEEQAATLPPVHKFRAEDLVVKTLLLAALVPNVPALNGLTATRLAALNHGSIRSMVPNQERAMVTAVLKALNTEFGEVRLSGSEDDPRVELALIGIDTDGILRESRHVDNDAARRRLVRDLLWEELKITDDGAFETRATVTWRGTARTVEVLMENASDPDRMSIRRFAANPATIRMILDYPFDEGGRFPSDDVIRVNQVRLQLGDEDTLVWLPHFLSDERISNLSDLIVINYLLERDRLAEATPNLTVEDRYHARGQLESRKSALTSRLREALRRAYHVNSPEDADLGTRAPEFVMTLVRGLAPRIGIGQGLKGAFDRLCFQLLDHRFPAHPDFDSSGKGAALRGQELDIVLDVVDHAAQDKVGRYEVPRNHIATVKKIANPLKLGTMHEAAFVLGRDWVDALNRKASAEGIADVTVRQLREWIADAEPGLPVAVQDLIVACYAIQDNKAWLRGGRLMVEAPKLSGIAEDMTLRSQELPSEQEWELASARVHGIFRIARQPVRNARSVQELATAVRRNAAGRLEVAKALSGELASHAETLGLADAPRMETARLVPELLAKLAETTDPTETMRVLAGLELPRETAFYQAHLASAETVTIALRTTDWDVLNRLAATEDDDAEAAAIISVLRQAARHDEHEVALGEPLRKAGRDAIGLLMARARPVPVTTPRVTPTVVTPPEVRPVVEVIDQVRPDVVKPVPPVATLPPGKRVKAHDIARFVEKICEAADENPEAEFEISWRIVTD